MKKKYSDIEIKNIIDYEGKLNSHKKYLKMLDILEAKTSFIGITGKHEITQKFKNDIIQIEESNQWWASIVSYKETITFIRASKELFEYLKKYKTFCISRNIPYIPWYEIIDTGLNNCDIAFFDNKDNILLGTTTHEGFISVTKSISEEFQQTLKITKD